MDIQTVIVETTKRQAAEVLRHKAIHLTDNQIIDMCAGLKRAILEGYDGAIADAKEVVAANMGEALLRATLNASCASMAINGLKYAGIL